MNALLHVLKTHQEAKAAAELHEVAAAATVQQAATTTGQLEPAVAIESEENCPVIRANQVFLSAATSGRMRVVFF